MPGTGEPISWEELYRFGFVRLPTTSMRSEILVQDTLMENTLILSESITICEGEKLRNDLRQLIDSSEKPELDISRVGQIDLCTLQLIWAARKSAKEAGKALKLSAFPQACIETARLSGLHHLLDEANK